MLRLLGVRNSSAAVGFGLLAAGLGLLGAGSSGPAAIRYELDAPLLATGGRVFACFSDALMGPSFGCGGIELKGVDVSHLPDGGGDNGSPWSQPMRLVGTWDGQALTLTEAPRTARTASGPPQPCQQELGFEGAPGVMAREPEVYEGLKAHGITVLLSMPCDDTTLGFTVVVADDRTVSWVTSHYPHVKVVGWLRPLPSGP